MKSFIEKRNQLLSDLPESKDSLNISLIDSFDDNEILNLINEKYQHEVKGNPILIDRHRKATLMISIIG